MPIGVLSVLPAKCAICDKPLTLPRRHVDICGEQCFKALLRRQRLFAERAALGCGGDMFRLNGGFRARQAPLHRAQRLATMIVEGPDV